MATRTPLRRTVYIGTFLHSASLGDIEVSERTAIGVDEEGIITFIEKNLTDEQTILRCIEGNGWDAGEYDLVQAPEGDGVIRFWFPGFIGW
jgi:guanine deaminase